MINAQAIMQQHGKTFAVAARLLTAESRQDATALYAFARTVDDWIDLQATNIEAQAKVVAIESCFNQQLSAANSVEPINYADIAAIMQKHAVPNSVMHAFLQSQLHDEDCQQLQTKQALVNYAYGVAGSIGRLMRPIIGAPIESDLYATSLGIAMQLTNIARDVVEDAERKRIYVPREFLAQAVNPQKIMHPNQAEAAIIFNAITALLQLADTYYAFAEQGYYLIPLRNRLSIAAAGAMYRAIGIKILARGQSQYWQGRVSLGLLAKLAVASVAVAKTLCKNSVFNQSLDQTLAQASANITDSIQQAITQYDLAIK